MKNSMCSIERNDLNLDFVGIVEQNEIFELAHERLKESIPIIVSESKATFDFSADRSLFSITKRFAYERRYRLLF